MRKLIKALFLIFISNPLSIVFAQEKMPDVKDAKQYGKPFNHVPDRRDVTLYQVNMRAFSEGGNFKGVTARLDSIKALGINVIYLMPIYPVGKLKSVNSPYCIQDYLAINPEFGTMEDLQGLIDGAHKRNMAVLLDWVGNHTSFDHVWTRNKSWYKQDSAGNIISPPGTGWNDVAQLDFTNKDMRAEMICEMKYWVYAANIDGFRCDYADGPPVDFWRQAIDTLHNIKTHKLLMMAEGSRNANFDAGFDYNFGFNFFGTLEKIYHDHKSVLTIDSLNKADYNGTNNGQQMVRYTTNHDVNGSDGTPLKLFGGQDGSIAAFAVAALMKSVPMVYNGQEVGMKTPIVFPFTTVKVDWTPNPTVTDDYKKIIAFRNNSDAARRGALASYSTPDVCAFTKISGKEKVLVIANLRDSSINYDVPMALKNTSWTNGLNGGKIKVEKQLSLSPYEYFILRN